MDKFDIKKQELNQLHHMKQKLESKKYACTEEDVNQNSKWAAAPPVKDGEKCILSTKKKILVTWVGIDGEVWIICVMCGRF